MTLVLFFSFFFFPTSIATVSTLYSYNHELGYPFRHYETGLPLLKKS
jgi:hypothetical protein